MIPATRYRKQNAFVNGFGSKSSEIVGMRRSLLRLFHLIARFSPYNCVPYCRLITDCGGGSCAYCIVRMAYPVRYEGRTTRLLFVAGPLSTSWCAEGRLYLRRPPRGRINSINSVTRKGRMICMVSPLEPQLPGAVVAEQQRAAASLLDSGITGERQSAKPVGTA